MIDFNELGNNQTLAYRLINHIDPSAGLLNQIWRPRDGDSSGFRVCIYPFGIKSQSLYFLRQLIHIRHMMHRKSRRLTHQFRCTDDNRVFIRHPIKVEAASKIIHRLFARFPVQGNKHIPFQITVDDNILSRNFRNRI